MKTPTVSKRLGAEPGAGTPAATKLASSTTLATPAGSNPNAPTKAKNQPVHQIRHGAISASIWRQETDKGAMFNVSFQRSYKEGDAWKTSTSFGRSNLLVLSLIAARAFEWIGKQPRTPRPELSRAGA